MEEAKKMAGTWRPRILHLWIVILLLAGGAEAGTNNADIVALKAVKAALQDPFNKLVSWQGADPCAGRAWAGVICESDANGVRTVIELRLLEMGLEGTLAPEVGNLQSLVTLNVMWNNITGSLPSSIGNLQNLVLLLVSGNQMSGQLPPELGQLKNLNRLQVDENNFTGPIPTTFTQLTSVKHLHLNNNSLSGSIPANLGSLPNILHILVDNNQLTGAIPPDLANSSTLHILQLDNNPLDAQPIPGSFFEPRRFNTLLKLSMRRCNLAGELPRQITNMASLKFLDLSQNALAGTVPALPLPNLTSVYLSANNFSEDVGRVTLTGLPELQALLLADNNFSGTVNLSSLLGLGPDGPRDPIIVDLQDNSIVSFSPLRKVELWLRSNPICKSVNSVFADCQPKPEIAVSQPELDSGDNETVSNCTGLQCPKDQAAWAVGGSPCFCRYLVTLRLRLKSPSFTLFAPQISIYEAYIAEAVTTASNQTFLSPGQVHVQSYTWQAGRRMLLDLQLFPDPKDRFEQYQADEVFSIFSNWKFPEEPDTGPYEFISWIPGVYGTTEDGGKGGIGVGVVAGAVVAAVAATAVLAVVIGVWVVRRTRKEEKGKWTRKATTVRRGLLGGDRSSVQITGVKEFTYRELSDATDGFSEERSIGRGGYGRVYYGELAEEGKVAIKRAQEGSLQGSHEFYTEIELLSRVHHRNLVKLVGYCHDQEEQMLVYEYMEGGTLRDNLSAKGEQLGLDLPARLRIAMGSARGIAYLHNEANPPIFHRDIKATNILLDRKLNAKVADFGLSKLAPAPDQEGSGPGHVSTVVKGTPGYLDPEYFLTHKLTDKSDVYSFGVVLLELITGLHPISHGKNIVRVVRTAHEAGSVLDIVDPRMGPLLPEVIHPLVSLALSCCQDDPDKRPGIVEVVRDLDDIWHTMPWGVSTDTEGSSRMLSRGPLRTPFQDDSSDISNAGGLISGTVIDVSPR